MSTIDATVTLDSPAQLYLETLSAGSQGLRSTLDRLARLLEPESNADSYPWHQLRYRDTARLRRVLTAAYKPATVNKMLAALRGVLKQTWRLGLVDADTYRRAADVQNVRATTRLAGRALDGDEIEALFATCLDDPSPKGARDAAMLAVFYGCGLRRGELARLDIDSFDPDSGSLQVDGKRQKQRTVYLTDEGIEHLRAWVEARGTEPGPLFVPVDRADQIRATRLRGESITYILRRRQEQAGLGEFSPHDLRRTFVTHLLDAGEDLLTVKRLAGHADVQTTARYDRRGEGAKRRAVQSLRLPSRPS